MFRIKSFRLFFFIPVIYVGAGFIVSIYNIAAAMAVILLGALSYLINYLMIACPQCGKSPYIRKTGATSFLMPSVYSSPIVEKSCSRCGREF